MIPKTVWCMDNKALEDWKTTHEEYDFKVFDFNQIDTFLEDYGPCFHEDLLSTYRSLNAFKNKIDVWKLLALYREGGIYIDTIFKGNESFHLDELLDQAPIFVRDNGINNYGIHTGLIVVEPECLIIKKTLLQIIKNIKEKFYGYHPESLTGTLVIKRFVNWNEDNRYSIQTTMKDLTLICRDDEPILLQCKCDVYYKQLVELWKHHSLVLHQYDPLPKYPKVSICTPTFNRRQRIPQLIRCVENQTYPTEYLEWIIIDDGDDPIEDLVKDIPYVKYFRYQTKLPLGLKRNMLNDRSTGDILVYFDDDDLHHVERIEQSVNSLRENLNYGVAGNSIIYIYFEDLKEMYMFGPYWRNHATAGTFAIRKEFLAESVYDNSKLQAEEASFLKQYSVPLLQLDPKKTIVVINHDRNTVDKKTKIGSRECHSTELTLSDFGFDNI